MRRQRLLRFHDFVDAVLRYGTERRWRVRSRLSLAILMLAVAVAAGGCRASTDLTELGAGANAQWDNGPKVGVSGSLGKHEAEVAPLFGPGLSGEAAPSQVPPSPQASAPAAGAASPSPTSGGSGWLLLVLLAVLIGGGAWLVVRNRSKPAPKAA